MKNAFLVVTVAQLALALSFTPGAESGLCPTGTTSMEVTTTSDLQSMINTINCTGEGTFNVTWIGTVPLVQTIEVCEEKQLTVTGSTSYESTSAGSTSAFADVPSAVIDAGRTTGIFRVCAGSTLRLKRLVLEGGASTSGAAVNASSFSSVIVDNCTFTNNSATDGGAIYAASSEIYIHGNTVFKDNSAEGYGGALSVDSNSTVSMDGSTFFYRNSAGGDGGAISASASSSIHVDGNTYFGNNAAEDDGGAMSASGDSSINIDGNTDFDSNISEDNGGALFAVDYSSIRIKGNTSFDENQSVEGGGAVSVSQDSSIRVEGTTYFENNLAKLEGGAIYLGIDSAMEIDGNTYFRRNTAEDNGELEHLSDKLAGFKSPVLTKDSSISVYGDTYFVGNKAGRNAGAVYVTSYSSAQIGDLCYFDSNTAVDDGGAVYVFSESSMSVYGNTHFVYNEAGRHAGAIYVKSNSSVSIEGSASFQSNTAEDYGGAIHASINCSVEIAGNTSIQNNFADEYGGAIFVSDSTMRIGGNTSVIQNSANWPGGGALYASQSEVTIEECAYFASNYAYDGGAILTHKADITITGNAAFAYNSAERDGGAIKIIDSTATIVGGSELSSTNALSKGASSSTQLVEEHTTTGTISFIDNRALVDGGSISLTNPDKVLIRDVDFFSNEAMLGGAVSLTSSAAESSVEFELCRFQSNNASRGGALYLNGEGQGMIRGSGFYDNVADEMGGAIYNADPLEIYDTEFEGNMAGDDGLALHNEDSDLLLLWNVTFSGNLLSCPSQEYNTDDTSSSSCRFELVCAQCLEGCDSDLVNVTIGGKTPPTCESVPEGVEPSSAMTTVQTFVIKEGYYRVSSDSAIVLECYQEDACVGGSNASNYCESGYKGPYCAVCEKDFAPGANNRCYKCSGNNRRLTAAFAAAFLVGLLLVGLFIVSYLLRTVDDGGQPAGNDARHPWRQKLSSLQSAVAKAVPLSAVSIVVVVLQIVTQFSEIAGSVYPDEYEAFLSRMTFVNLDIGFILSTSCMLATDFYDRLVIATVGPLVFILACAGTFVIARARSRTYSTTGPALKQKHVSVVLFIVFFVYSSVSFTVLQTFACDSLDDGKAYLRADYSITCHTQTHTAYKTYASFMVCVYPVGIPLFFAWWLVRNRRQLETPGRESKSDLQSFRFLWAGYKPSCYYYEVVECGRRIVLTGAAVFVLPDTAEQIAIVLLLAVVLMFVSESLSPFESKLDMWLYRWGNGIILASMYVALLLKFDFATEGSRSSSVITALLIGANVFMLFTVAVQAALLVKGLYESRVEEQPSPARHSISSWFAQAAEGEVFAVELEISPMNNQREHAGRDS